MDGLLSEKIKLTFFFLLVKLYPGNQSQCHISPFFGCQRQCTSGPLQLLDGRWVKCLQTRRPGDVADVGDGKKLYFAKMSSLRMRFVFIIFSRWKEWKYLQEFCKWISDHYTEEVVWKPFNVHSDVERMSQFQRPNSSFLCILHNPAPRFASREAAT